MTGIVIDLRHIREERGPDRRALRGEPWTPYVILRLEDAKALADAAVRLASGGATAQATARNERAGNIAATFEGDTGADNGVTSEQADAVRFAMQRGARFELHLSAPEDPLRAEVDALKARLMELEAKLS